MLLLTVCVSALAAEERGGLSSPFIGASSEVVWLGDSVVRGDPTEPKTFYAIPDYTDIGSGRIYHNEAVGGSTLARIASTAAGKVALWPNATGVIFNGGINDTAFDSITVDDMLNSAAAIVTAVSPLPVMYISIAPFQGGYSWTEASQAKIDEFNARFSTWCDANGVLFIDSRKVLLDPTRPDENFKDPIYNAISDAHPFSHMSEAGCSAIGAEIEAVASDQLTRRIDIDVSPWSQANVVYPDTDNPLEVALLGSIEFDVTQIDPGTLKLGRSEAAVSAPNPWFENVDNDPDGLLDATFVFDTQMTGIVCGDTEITLKGSTYGEIAFEGTDTIDANDCDKGGCHP